jgi:hypothetical protein
MHAGLFGRPGELLAIADLIQQNLSLAGLFRTSGGGQLADVW